MINELLEVAKRYQIASIIKKLEELQKPVRIKIGFLGEFNSGKSSLINAMLGQKILPAMEKPTTKNVIIIIPEIATKEIKFYKEENGEFVEIEPLEFQEIALGRKEGIALIKLPSSEYLPEGIEIVDTPGLASLEKTDTEITFGYLPELDAAVICQDITFGTIPASVLEFLKRPDVKHLLNKLLFVLTKADRVREKEAEEARKHTIQVIQNLFNELGIKEKAEDRVFITSAKKALEGERESINEFLRGLQEKVFNKKEAIEKERRLKEASKIADELAEALKNLLEGLELNSSQIDKEIEVVEKELYQIEREKNKLQRAIEKIAEQSFHIAEKLLKAYKTSITSAEDEESLTQILTQIEQEFTHKLSRLIERKLRISEELPSTVVKEAINSIKEQIANELKKIEIIKLILTGILTAVVAPGTGAVNAVEGTAGAVISRLKSVGNIMSKLGLSKVGKVLTTVIKNINPVEILGNPLARKYLASKYDELVPQIASLVSENIREELERILEDIFNDLEEKVEVKKDVLIQLKEQKLNSIKKLNNYKQELLRDIEKVEKLARSV